MILRFFGDRTISATSRQIIIDRILAIVTVIVNRGINRSTDNRAALVIKIHGELPYRFGHMEVMFSFNDLRKLRPHLCMAFKPAFTGENRMDICISVSAAVLNFTGSI